MNMAESIVALTSNRERPASTSTGYIWLLVMLVSLAIFAWGFRQVIADRPDTLSIWAMIAGIAVFVFVSCGFYMLQPNQAAAITLFGDYKGTDSTTGLRWVLKLVIG
jgi:hypothetical protein